MTVDRDGDTLDPGGVDLTNFSKNGPVLFGHRRDEIPVGQATTVWLDRQGNLQMQWRWLEGDPLADRVKNAWQQGILRAMSVGFLPKASAPNKHGGRHYEEWELLEASIVPIPSNPSAVAALKSLGLYDDGHGCKGWGQEEELEIADSLFDRMPGLAREVIHDAQRGRGEIEFDADELNAMFRRHLPAIVGQAVDEVLIQEITRAFNRLRGRLD